MRGLVDQPDGMAGLNAAAFLRRDSQIKTPASSRLADKLKLASAA